MIATYINISLISMVVRLIVEKDNLEEQEAITAFYSSEIAEKIADKDLGLYRLSPYLIYELWNAESQTGDFRKSPYFLGIL